MIVTDRLTMRDWDDGRKKGCGATLLRRDVSLVVYAVRRSGSIGEPPIDGSASKAGRANQ